MIVTYAALHPYFIYEAIGQAIQYWWHSLKIETKINCTLISSKEKERCFEGQGLKYKKKKHLK